MTPTIGRIVVYKLSEYDRKQLNALGSGNPNNGAVEAPAIITRVWTDTTVNLKVMIDGDQTLWATSRVLGESDGNWSWPARV